MLNNAKWLDPVGGLVISLMVVQAGWGNTKQALLELADVGVDQEMKDNVRKAATSAVEGITTTSEPVNVRAIQGVKAGQNYLMDVEIGVSSAWTIEQTRDVENLIRERIGANVREDPSQCSQRDLACRHDFRKLKQLRLWYIRCQRSG